MKLNIYKVSDPKKVLDGFGFDKLMIGPNEKDVRNWWEHSELLSSKSILFELVDTVDIDDNLMQVINDACKQIGGNFADENYIYTCGRLIPNEINFYNHDVLMARKEKIIKKLRKEIRNDQGEIIRHSNAIEKQYELIKKLKSFK